MSARIDFKLIAKLPPTNFITIFKKAALLKANEMTEERVKEISARAKEIIRGQQFDWVPLMPGYSRHKIKKGLDPRILIATKDYVNNGIGWYKKADRYYVGALEGTHKTSKLPYRYLARIHEFGTWAIPARPLWRPLLSTIMREHKNFARAYHKAVREAVKTKLANRKVVVIKSNA